MKRNSVPYAMLLRCLNLNISCVRSWSTAVIYHSVPICLQLSSELVAFLSGFCPKKMISLWPGIWISWCMARHLDRVRAAGLAVYRRDECSVTVTDGEYRKPNREGDSSEFVPGREVKEDKHCQSYCTLLEKGVDRIYR